MFVLCGTLNNCHLFDCLVSGLETHSTRDMFTHTYVHTRTHKDTPLYLHTRRKKKEYTDCTHVTTTLYVHTHTHVRTKHACAHNIYTNSCTVQNKIKINTQKVTAYTKLLQEILRSLYFYVNKCNCNQTSLQLLFF